MAKRSNFGFYLLQKSKNHPSFKAQDAIKLSYQNAFGGEHLLTDQILAQKLLENEWRKTPPSDGPLYEPISPCLCRMNIGPAKKAKLSEKDFYEIFAESSFKFKNTDKKPFESNLQIITRLAKEKRLPFSEASWKEALAVYRKGGLHPVHHSSEYETQEKPHYRLALIALLLEKVKK